MTDNVVCLAEWLDARDRENMLAYLREAPRETPASPQHFLRQILEEALPPDANIWIRGDEMPPGGDAA